MRLKIIGVARGYKQLIAILRARADEMQITRETTDANGGLPSGYSGKLLSSIPTRIFGQMSLSVMLTLLRIKLIVAIDEDAPKIDLPKRTRRATSRTVPTPVNPQSHAEAQ